MSGPVKRLPPGPEEGRTRSIPGMWTVPAEATTPRRPRGPSPRGPRLAAALAVVAFALAGGALIAREKGWIFEEPSSPAVAAAETAPPEGPKPRTPETPAPSARMASPEAPLTAPEVATAAPEAATAAPPGEASEPPEAAKEVQEGAPKPPTAQPEPQLVAAAPEEADEPEELTEPEEADEPLNPLLTELPARRKARGFSERAAKQLLKGNDKNARLLLERALRLDPTYAPAWRDLGIARARLGEVEGAREAYRKYLDLAPDAPDAPDVRRILGL